MCFCCSSVFLCSARAILRSMGVAKGDKFNPKGDKFNPKGDKFNPNVTHKNLTVHPKR